MILVFVARNGVLFLIAWEVMALASYFLVVFEDEKEEVRRAGRTYLVATHLGTAGLLILFLMLGQSSGSLDFDALGIAAGPGGAASVAFLLAVIGFGTKAGFMPFHVWLPEAHPASPSHVSAVMSGVMIKTGIYGLVRTITFLGSPPPWWGWTILAIGVSSGVLGVLFALAQHDLKRLLAYHSVENIGIIAIGLGVGLLGKSYDLPAMVYLGFAGAMLHVVNHAIFKGLLFLAAGAIGHATHTLEIDRMGGLLKRMPWTAVLFLVGSVAICGLPPLNGFVSEFLIYLGAFKGIVDLGAAGAAAGAIAIGALALIGGLAAACFTKAFGILFLGEPRSSHAAGAIEPVWAIRVPMIALAVGCVGIGLLGPILVGGVRGVVASAAGLPLAEVAGSRDGHGVDAQDRPRRGGASHVRRRARIPSLAVAGRAGLSRPPRLGIADTRLRTRECSTRLRGSPSRSRVSSTSCSGRAASTHRPAVSSRRIPPCPRTPRIRCTRACTSLSSQAGAGCSRSSAGCRADRCSSTSSTSPSRSCCFWSGSWPSP